MRLIKTSSLDPQSVQVTIAGVATGAATLLLRCDGVLSTYVTIAAESAADAATNWATQLATDLGAGYTISALAGVITITKDLGNIFPVFAFETDATQSAVISSSFQDSSALVSNVTTAATGRPTSSTSGFAVPGSEDNARTLFIKGRLANLAGAAKSCRFKVWLYDTARGWYVSEVIGTRTISDAGSSAISSTVLCLDLEANALRVAIELVDDGAGGNLANCAFSGWVAIKG